MFNSCLLRSNFAAANAANAALAGTAPLLPFRPPSRMAPAPDHGHHNSVRKKMLTVFVIEMLFFIVGFWVANHLAH